MSRTGKIIAILLSAAAAFLMAAWLFIGAVWSGAFNFMFPTEIAAYQSPDGQYTLVFEQMGDPGWPFGPADVRLTLKNSHGKRIGRVSAQVFNDGGNAGEQNVGSVSWNDDGVIVVLRSAEAEDQEISILYDQR